MKQCPIPMDCMDLRDYFAAKAMQSYIAIGAFSGIPSEEIRDQFIATESYAMADLMIKARK